MRKVWNSNAPWTLFQYKKDQGTFSTLYRHMFHLESAGEMTDTNETEGM